MKAALTPFSPNEQGATYKLFPSGDRGEEAGRLHL